jgi:hypothetical protein
MTLTDPMKDALNLLQRFQQGELFRHYVVQRAWLVAPVVILLLVTSVMLAFGIIAYVGGTRSIMVLLALLLAPFVLAGSLLVQGYIFMSWLEGRALARSLGHKVGSSRGRLAALIQERLDADLGSAPPIPWLFVGLFIVLPFVALFLSVPKLAIAVAVANIVAPVAYARFDR